MPKRMGRSVKVRKIIDSTTTFDTRILLNIIVMTHATAMNELAVSVRQYCTVLCDEGEASLSSENAERNRIGIR